MKIEDIKLRLDMAEAKLLKTEQTIARLEKQRDNKKERLMQLGVDPLLVDLNDIRNNLAAYLAYTDYQDKMESIENNTKKAGEIRSSINQYRAQLNHEMARDAFIQNDVPQIIRDFFESWQENAYISVQMRYESYQELKKQLTVDLREARIEAISTLPEYERYRERKSPSEMSDYELSGVYPLKPMDNFLKARNLDSRSIAQRKQAAAGPFVTKMLQLRTPEERAEWLTKELEAEKRERILDLSDRVGKIVGRITDATNLHLQNGEICGIIIGEQVAATIQTVGAGGHTIQCFHYRTLVKEVEVPQEVPEDDEDFDMEM